MNAPQEYLASGEYIDSAHPAVTAFAQAHAKGADDLARGIALYYAVRDRIHYNPFLDFTVAGAYRASECVISGEGFCVGKASLLAATARAAGIAARVGFADVKNHLTTPRLREFMGSDEFIYHGFAELLLEGKWVKATPAFNLALCEKFRVKPLEFDGRNDSIFHPFDADERRHMEYLRDRGSFADVPVEEIRAAFRVYYPRLYALRGSAAKESFG
ncbi:MAG: transglutaminase family protein [Betaproteobacteria bacterium]|nr:transglutaminase family protein [Betaproteobacteria bacterium]